MAARIWPRPDGQWPAERERRTVWRRSWQAEFRGQEPEATEPGRTVQGQREAPERTPGRRQALEQAVALERMPGRRQTLEQTAGPEQAPGRRQTLEQAAGPEQAPEQAAGPEQAVALERMPGRRQVLEQAVALEQAPGRTRALVWVLRKTAHPPKPNQANPRIWPAPAIRRPFRRTWVWGQLAQTRPPQTEVALLPVPGSSRPLIQAGLQPDAPVSPAPSTVLLVPRAASKPGTNHPANSWEKRPPLGAWTVLQEASAW